MAGYVKLQIVYIHKYARHLHVTDEEATWQWVSSGLAKKFAQIYRKRFGMSKERN